MVDTKIAWFLVSGKEEAYKKFHEIHERFHGIVWNTFTGRDLGQKLCDRWSSATRATLRTVLIWIMILRKPKPRGIRRVPHRRIFTTNDGLPCPLACTLTISEIGVWKRQHCYFAFVMFINTFFHVQMCTNISEKCGTLL